MPVQDRLMSEPSQTHQPSRAHTDHLRGRVAALLAGSSSLGMAPICARWGVRLGGMGPVAVGFWRLLLSLPLMFAWVLATRRQRRLRRAGEMRLDKLAVLMAAAGGMCFGVDIALFHLAVDKTTAVNATLMSNCAPIFVAFAAWTIFRERFNWVFVVGLALTLAGVAALASAENMTQRASQASTHSHSLVGDTLALVSAIFYAGYQLCIKRARRTMATATTMAISASASSVVLIVASVLLGERVAPTAAVGWAIIIALATFVQVGGQCVIVWAMGRLPVSFSSVGLLFQPVVVAALGWMLLGETLGPFHAAGAAAVLTGIYLARLGSANAVAVSGEPELPANSQSPAEVASD